jgi:hypothetical protein
MIDIVKPNIKFSHLSYDSLEKITDDNVKSTIELFDNFLKYVSYIQEGTDIDTLAKKSISKFCSINLVPLKGLKKESDSPLPIYRIVEDYLTQKNIFNYMSHTNFEDYCTDVVCKTTRDLFKNKYAEICGKHLGIVFKEESNKPEVTKKQEIKPKAENLENNKNDIILKDIEECKPETLGAAVISKNEKLKEKVDNKKDFEIEDDKIANKGEEAKQDKVENVKLLEDKKINETLNKKDNENQENVEQEETHKKKEFKKLLSIFEKKGSNNLDDKNVKSFMKKNTQNQINIEIDEDLKIETDPKNKLNTAKFNKKMW